MSVKTIKERLIHITCLLSALLIIGSCGKQNGNNTSNLPTSIICPDNATCTETTATCNNGYKGTLVLNDSKTAFEGICEIDPCAEHEVLIPTNTYDQIQELDYEYKVTNNQIVHEPTSEVVIENITPIMLVTSFNVYSKGLVNSPWVIPGTILSPLIKSQLFGDDISEEQISSFNVIMDQLIFGTIDLTGIISGQQRAILVMALEKPNGSFFTWEEIKNIPFQLHELETPGCNQVPNILDIDDTEQFLIIQAYKGIGEAAAPLYKYVTVKLNQYVYIFRTNEFNSMTSEDIKTMVNQILPDESP